MGSPTLDRYLSGLEVRMGADGDEIDEVGGDEVGGDQVDDPDGWLRPKELETAPPPLGYQPRVTVFRPKGSTPLEAGEPEDEDTIPDAALWVMKYRRHLRLGLHGREDERLRAVIGEGDTTAYVIDDGPRHYMVARLVGEDSEGLVYCLVGRIDLAAFELYANLDAPAEDVFADARDLAVCSVFDAPEDVSNVLLIATYRHVDEVPPDYLPPNPFLEFT